MERNKYLRTYVAALLGVVVAFPVVAYTGGVTTYRGSPTIAGNVERAYTAPAKAGVEHDATYQRTMRKAQTAAAAATAARGILKTISGVGLLLTVLQLASDVNGIWTKDAAGNNVLQVLPKGVCTTAPCYSYLPTEGPQTQFRTPEEACQSIVAYRQTVSPGRFTYKGLNADGTQCQMNGDGMTWGAGITKTSVQPETNAQRVPIDPLEFQERLKDSPKLPSLLDELEKAGSPVPFPGDEVEDMPLPLSLLPRVTVNPDGSKTISKTVLTPYRAPDGTTVNWERKVTVTQESAPDANGNTTKRDTTTTDNSKSNEIPPQKSECEKSPKALGCAELDIPDGEIPKSQKNVSYAAEVMFGGGSCPASKTIQQSLTGRPIVLSYAQTCDALSIYVKPIIIAIALFMAYLIILPGNRE